MKHLFIWENGDAGDFILCASQFAQVIRSAGESEILFATMNRIGSEDFSWADRVLTASGIKVKSSHTGKGHWQQLHNSGWTDPDLRALVYETWSALLRAEKPDVVYTWGSASATLICVMEDIKVIQMGTGANILEPEDTEGDCSFPELSAWIYQFTDRPLGKLLHQPSFIFCDPRVDRPRTGMYFHMAPTLTTLIGLESSPDAEIIMVKGMSKESRALQDQLEAMYGSNVAIMSRSQWYRCALAVLSRQLQGQQTLLFSHFDPIVFSQALYYGINHIGIAMGGFERTVADNAQSAGLGIQVSGHPETLEREISQARLQTALTNKAGAGYCPMENAFKWIISSV